MQLKYASQICRAYICSGKCPLVSICKKKVKLYREDIEEWAKQLEVAAMDLLENGGNHQNE